MIAGVILWAVISLVIIMLTHNIYIFLKDTLTVPKVKDFINEPNNIYKEVEDTLKKNRENNSNNNLEIKNNINENEMKNELKNFFKELNTEKPINLENNFSYTATIF